MSTPGVVQYIIYRVLSTRGGYTGMGQVFTVARGGVVEYRASQNATLVWESTLDAVEITLCSKNVP